MIRCRDVFVLFTTALTTIQAVNAQANECQSPILEEYLWSRYLLCQNYIAEENYRQFLAQRFDGAVRIISVEGAEQIILSLNEARDGEGDSIAALTETNVTVRVALRGLLARQVFSEEFVSSYCSYKLSDEHPDDLSLPSITDPEYVRDIDFFLGCSDE